MGRMMTERKSFSKSKYSLEIPFLLEVQLDSYKRFLQKDVHPKDRKLDGLEAVFQEAFPITDTKGFYELCYKEYHIGEPKYSIPECQNRGMTYDAPLHAKLALRVYEGEGEERRFKEESINDVYFGDIPLITDNGTFIINGAERVVVSQMHRSPGVTFDEEQHPNGKRLFKARIIPYRGSWVEFLIDVNDAMYINIDRRKKLPATMLLRALGCSPEAGDAASDTRNADILKLFYQTREAEVDELLAISEEEGEEWNGAVLADDVINGDGEVIYEANQLLGNDELQGLKEQNVKSVQIVDGDVEKDPVIYNTILSDTSISGDDAAIKICNVIHPGDTLTGDAARQQLNQLFFNERRYDLGEVGRYRMNSRLNVNVPMATRIVTREDFLAVMRYLVGLFNGKMKKSDGSEFVPEIDDIDHLGNRRARSVGELLANQFQLAFMRMNRTIHERLSLRESEEQTPQDLVNSRTINALISSFLGSSQLSQFMDQTNP